MTLKGKGKLDAWRLVRRTPQPTPQEEKARAGSPGL
jgi:hypothetical protein